MKPPKPVELDGRTGEGGGQLVRIAVALSSVSGVPIRITNVRGNRPGPPGGGLKSQHVTSIAWLARATDADTKGLDVGSKTLEFRPRRRPWDLPPPSAAGAPASALPSDPALGPADGTVRIAADSPAASALLIFQAILPFLLFAPGPGPTRLELHGGTHVSFAPSYDYLDQVLLPALHAAFGLRVDRRLVRRGWSVGPPARGCIALTVHPLPPGRALTPAPPRAARPPGDFDVAAVAATVVAPAALHAALARALARDLGALFPAADVELAPAEDGGHDARVYVLLVARGGGGADALRWGRDCLFAEKRRGRDATVLADAVSRRVCRALYDEVGRRGVVDEFLQDQLVVFQALAAGRTGFARPEEEGEGGPEGLAAAMQQLAVGEAEGLRRDRATEPFGEGSSHTTTARWVTAELLPRVQWFNGGRVCEGVGMAAPEPTTTQTTGEASTASG